MRSKYFSVLATVVVLLTCRPAMGGTAATVDFFVPAATFEGGALYLSGKIPVLDLHGTYRQMGRQYGHLMKDRLERLYASAIEKHFIEEKGIAYRTLRDTATALFEFYPRRFKDIVYGMAQTSGLSLEQHVVLNALELYGSIAGCSGIAAWGAHTGGGPLVFGRNYDWFDSYTPFARDLTVAVYHPDAGIPAATVTFAGVIYATTGLNAGGIFLELNNGLPSGGALTFTNRVHAIVQLMGFLFDYDTMAQLDAAFNSTRSNFAFIVNTADETRAWSYEWPPFGLVRRGGDAAGLLVSTNHFVDPSWGIAMQGNTGFESVRRRDNLLALSGKYKGRIDLEAMKAILDTPMAAGGATWPLEGPIRTVYQIIAVPGQRQLWVQVPDWQEWTRIDLAGMLTAPGVN